MDFRTKMNGQFLLKTAFIMIMAWIALSAFTQTQSHAALIDAEGTDSLDITNCTGLLGYNIPLPGNVSDPIGTIAPDEMYIAYISDPAGSSNSANQVVITKYNGSTCTTPTELTDNTETHTRPSHNAPSVYADKNDYIYVTHSLNHSDYRQGGPFIMRSINPNDETSFTTEERMRFPQNAETNGFTMKDGNVLIGGTDIRSRFEIVEPYDGGTTDIIYKNTYAKQVVDSLSDGSTANSADKDFDCHGNRFTKGYYQEGIGSDDNIYIIWGWGGTGWTPHPCGDGDMPKYSGDSHELYFAYSDDGGDNWKNIDNTSTISAVDCPHPTDCRGSLLDGIQYNDDDFKITTLRQREKRQFWAHPDGTIYIAFAKSALCLTGICESDMNPTAPNEGALTLLKFRLGDTINDVEEITVNSNEHVFMGAVRKHGEDLYIWAHEKNDGVSDTNDIYEYKSTDDGASWTRTKLNTSSMSCNRLHAESYNPRVKNSIRLIWTCNHPTTSLVDELFHYRRSLDPDTTLPTNWSNIDIGASTASGHTTYLEDGTFIVHGAGADIWGTDDEYRYVYTTLSGDFEISAKVAEIEDTHDYAQAGIMARESTAAGSKHAFMALRQLDYGAFKRRTSTDGTSTNTLSSSAIEQPYYVKLKRTGNVFEGFVSPDGQTWTSVSSETISMNSSILVGFAVTSRDNGVLNSSTFTDISGVDVINPVRVRDLVTGDITETTDDSIKLTWTAPGDDLVTGTAVSYDIRYSTSPITDANFSSAIQVSGEPTPSAAGSAETMTVSGLNNGTTYYFAIKTTDDASNVSYISNIVSGTTTTWTSTDIGTVGSSGSGSESNGTYTVSGAGYEIWDFADGFHFYHKPLSGDSEIVARITDTGNTIGDNNAGVMIRESLDAGSKHMFVALRGAGGVASKRRTSTDGSTTNTLLNTGATEPYWVKLTRSGDTLTGYYSSDGSTWTQTVQETISMSDTAYFGLALVAGDDTLVDATFDNVSLSTDQVAPAALTDLATSSPTTDAITVSWTAPGDDGSTSTATSYDLRYSTSYITEDNFSSAMQVSGEPTPSAAGNSEQLTISGFDPDTYYYFAIKTSDEGGNVSDLSNIVYAQTKQVWVNTDIGTVSSSGSGSESGGTFTVTGAGDDIWGTADELNLHYKTIEGDGEIVARVTDTGNTIGDNNAGVMIRESLDADSKHMFVGLRGAGGVATKRRTATGGTTDNDLLNTSASEPYWVKIVRSNKWKTLTGYYSSDGVSWTQTVQIDIQMDYEVYAGLALVAGDDTLVTAKFDNVSWTE